MRRISISEPSAIRLFNARDKYWLYGLLASSETTELSQWIELLQEKEIETVLCVKIYLEKHFKDAPIIAYSPYSEPDDIARIVEPVLAWYAQRKKD